MSKYASSIWAGLTLTAMTVAAQTITGSGTSGTVPLFTGTSTVTNSAITQSGGNIGIGTTNSNSALQVNGTINQTTLNQSIVMVTPGSAQYYHVATLPVSAVSTLDHLRLQAVLDDSWGSISKSFLDAYFANRNSFVYSYNRWGSAGNGNIRLVAYNSNGQVDIYIYFTNTYPWASASVTVLENLQETIYPTLPAVGAATPAGTLVFDSSNSNYPPTIAEIGSSVGIGTTTPGATLEVNGSLKLTSGSGASITFADGTTQSTAFTGVLCGGDYAESVDVSGDRTKYAPGDVLVLDRDRAGRILRSISAYSTDVSGVYSTKPGVVGRRQTITKSPEEIPMAIVGIVPTKVSAENGSIRIGDLLVSSSTSGYAMKGTDRSRMLGAVIGKAMDNLDSGTGMIEVLVTLQ